MQALVQNISFYIHQFFFPSDLISRDIPAPCLLSILSSFCSRNLLLLIPASSTCLGSPIEFLCLFCLPKGILRTHLPSPCIQFTSLDCQTSHPPPSTLLPQSHLILGPPQPTPFSETAYWKVSDDLLNGNWSLSPSHRHLCGVIYRLDPAAQAGSPYSTCGFTTSLGFFFWRKPLLGFHLPSLQVPFLLFKVWSSPSSSPASKPL